MQRTMARGNRVRVNQLKPRIGMTRQFAHTGELLREYPGGQYDSGTMWLVRYDNGNTLPADESMMSLA